MLAKAREGIWFVIFVSLPQILAARTPLPFIILMVALLIFVAVWLIRARSTNPVKGDIPAEIMGVDKVGIAILAAMGAYLTLIKLAMSFGPPWILWVIIPMTVALALIGMIVKATIDVRKRKEAAERSATAASHPEKA